MQFVASAVTAFALLAHAVLGCCSHHAHAAEGTSEDAVVSKADCCHEHECHESKPADGDHQEQLPCDEADCSFASDGSRMTVDSPFCGLALPLVIMAPEQRRACRSADHDDRLERLHGAAIYILHQRLNV